MNLKDVDVQVYTAMYKRLSVLVDKVSEDPCGPGGICGNMEIVWRKVWDQLPRVTKGELFGYDLDELYNRYDTWLRAAMVGWDGSSGDATYPVPAPDVILESARKSSKPVEMFAYDNLPLYGEGQYGDARRALAAHLMGLCIYNGAMIDGI